MDHILQFIKPKDNAEYMKVPTENKPELTRNEVLQGWFLILHAHKLQQPPFGLLPVELVQHILLYTHVPPRWLLETASHPEWTVLSDNDTTFSNLPLAGYTWVTILNDRVRKAGKKCQWVYRIAKLQADELSNIVLGVTCEPIKRGGSCLGLKQGMVGRNNPAKEWGFYMYPRYGSSARHNDAGATYTPDFPGAKTGDIMTVNLDEEGRLSYAHNGKDLGVAFTNVEGEVYGAVTFGSPNQGITVLPYEPKRE